MPGDWREEMGSYLTTDTYDGWLKAARDAAK